MKLIEKKKGMIEYTIAVDERELEMLVEGVCAAIKHCGGGCADKWYVLRDELSELIDGGTP